MSLDYQLAWSCPHEYLEEPVVLAEDRRTLGLASPIANSRTVNILIDNNFHVPSGGLYSMAVLKSSRSGPFDILKDEDDITIETSQGTQTLALGLTASVRWSASQVARKLLSLGLSVASIVDSDGILSLSDNRTVGSESFVKVTGSLCTSLGFVVQNRAHGKLVFPGWEIYGSNTEYSTRTIRFKSVVRGEHTIKVSYSTYPQKCLRCQATYVENDIRNAVDGNPILVADEDLLYQSTLKLLLTVKGSNPFHSWYGTSIKSRIGSKILGDVAALITEDIRQALVRYQAVQNEQAKYQTVTPEQKLYNILNIQVSPHIQDPTTYLVDVTVQNASLRPIELSIVYTAPEVVALMGSNGLYLGTEAVGIR